MGLSDPLLTRVAWPKAYRIIPSRFPPIDVFEDLGNSALLAELEGLTNPRLREQWGMITLIPAGRCVAGPGATYVMAPFVHANPLGSRFADGSYGVYYAASDLETAITETVHHMSEFYAATQSPPERNEFRCLVGSYVRRVAMASSMSVFVVMEAKILLHSGQMLSGFRSRNDTSSIIGMVNELTEYSIFTRNAGPKLSCLDRPAL